MDLNPGGLVQASVGVLAEAYRKAVDLNPKDYRAWYGLGQTYELLHMPVYALHYYQRATQVSAHACRSCTSAVSSSCALLSPRSLKLDSFYCPNHRYEKLPDFCQIEKTK